MSRLSAITLLLSILLWSPFQTGAEPTLPATPQNTLARPVHDDFADAAILSGLFVAWTNTTLGATLETGEELLNWDGPQSNASVWARWTAPESGPFRIVLSSDTHSAVYRGTSLASLDLISQYPSRVANIPAEAGITYHIRIISFAEPPDFALRLGPLVPNDTAAGAIVLEGSDLTISAHNWTSQRGFHAPHITLNHLLWYKWTAPGTGLLSYSTGTNLLSPSVVPYHLTLPTVESNLLFNYVLNYSAPPSSNSIAVTSGSVYLFGVSASPSTNLTFNLNFRAVDAAFPPDALLGGDILPVQETNVFFSSPNAAQLGPLTKTNQATWIEYTFPEPGFLYFKSKLQAAGFLLATLIIQPTSSSGQGTISLSNSHNWTDRALYLASSNTAVRFTFRTFNSSPASPAAAWIDDVHFVPLNPRPVHIRASLLDEGTLRVSSQLERYYSHKLESSTNLIDWTPIAGVRNFRSTNWSRIIPSTNSGGEYFRIRSLGGLNPD